MLKRLRILWYLDVYRVMIDLLIDIASVINKGISHIPTCWIVNLAIDYLDEEVA